MERNLPFVCSFPDKGCMTQIDTPMKYKNQKLNYAHFTLFLEFANKARNDHDDEINQLRKKHNLMVKEMFDANSTITELGRTHAEMQVRNQQYFFVQHRLFILMNYLNNIFALN